MQQTWLIIGPPGCGKTNWIRETLLNYQGERVYLRLDGCSHEGLEAGINAGIDRAWLSDQIPQLIDLPPAGLQELPPSAHRLVLVEAQQFKPSTKTDATGIDSRIQQQLELFNLRPDRTLLFGRDSDLPQQDTLDFTQLEAWNLALHGCVWDPNSLSSFWFELVNGAYGDVYRAKALMNLPDGRSFFCNWMVSQGSSQFFPLEVVEPLTSRPNRISHLVVQGKALDHAGIKSTINDCLLADNVLEMQQAQLRQQQQDLQPTR
jgi:hypothetical protein